MLVVAANPKVEEFDNQSAEEKMENIPADYDGSWKQAVIDYFPACMEFFYPAAHGDIDWERGYKILNTELQKTFPEAKVGKRVVDILVKVWRKEGSPINVLVHVEIQSEYEVQFPKRIHVYNSAIELRYDAPVASLVILGDDRPSWRPQEFESQIWESRTYRSYRAVKRLDYQNKWSELERSTNPFAVMVMAHLKTMATRQDARKRLEWKTRVTKGLLEGVNRGALQTGREYLIDMLVMKFDSVPEQISDRINKLEDASLLRELHQRSVTIASLSDFSAVLEQLTPAEDSSGQQYN